MTVQEFLSALSPTMPFTIGTERGTEWLVYSDGETETIIPEPFLIRPIVEIYPRNTREQRIEDGRATCQALKAGLAIIITGSEDGAI